MLTYFKKLPKIFKIIGTVILIVAFLCYLLFFNIEKLVSYGANKFVGLNLRVENIDFSFGNIKVEKLQILDKKERVAVNIPKIKLDYSLMKLKELNIDEAEIFVLNDDDGINIKNLINQKDKEKNKEKNKEIKEETDKEKKEIYEAESLAIEKININNLSLSYKDLKSDSRPEKQIGNINIMVDSGKDKGIFANLNIDNEIEKIDITYDNKKEPLYLELKISEIDLKKYEELLKIQFSKLEKISGKIEADAIISEKNNSGFIKFKNLDLYHRDIESDIRADLDIKLEKEDIDIIVDYEIFGEKNQIESMYKDGKLHSVVQIKNLNEAKLSKIVPLREKIDLSKIDIADIILLTRYNEDEGLKINFDLISNKAQIGKVVIDRIKADINLKNRIAQIENSYIKLKIADMPARMSLEGRADIDEKSADLIFQIQNLDKNSNLIPDFKGLVNIKDEDENLKIKLDSNIISFETFYDKIQEILNIYNDKFNFIYHGKDKKISGEGELEFSIYGLKNEIKYGIVDEKINFEKIKIENEKDRSKRLEAVGNYDLMSKDFVFDYDATELIISRLYKGDEINFTFRGKGKFEKYKNIFSGIGNIVGLNLGFLGEMNSITGDYQLKLNDKNELELEFDGKVEELVYENFKFKDVLVKLGFEKDMLNIKKIGNKNLDVRGKINKLTQESDLKISINNLTNKEIGYDKANFNIKNIDVTVKGDIKNPDVNLIIKKMELYLNDVVAKVTGNLKLSDKKLNISNLKINNNKISGKYDTETKRYNATVLIDDNLSNYLKDKKINYPLKGVLSLRGVDGKLNSTLELKGSGKLNDFNLPALDTKILYSAKNYSDGKVSLKKLSLKNSTAKEILNFGGFVDLKNKNINVYSDDIINLVDLFEYTKEKELNGEFKLDTNISGELSDPQYNLSLDSSVINFKKQELDKIIFKLNGDKKSLKVDDFSFNYLGNKILGSGFYNFFNKKYSFNLKNAHKINIADLNKLIKNEKIKTLKGEADFNILASDNGLNGFIKTDKVSLNLEKEAINLQNLDASIKFIDNEIKIENFLADINDGKVQLDGYVKFPKDFKNISENLDYFVNLKIDKVNYNKEDVANIRFSSNIEAKNKKIIGDIYIDEGIVYDVPNDYRNIWTIIKKQFSKKKKEKSETIFEKKSEQEKKKKNKKILKEISEKLEDVRLNLKTKTPLILDIDDFNIAIGEIRGKVDIDLELKGKRGKYNLFGQTELENTYIYINTNKFILDRALFSFNDGLVYLPEINPDIFIDTRVRMDEEDINFGIYGRLKDPIYTLSTENGSIRGDFNSLLVQSNDYSILEGNSGKVYKKFMKNIIAGQLTQAIFGPLTKGAKKVLNLSRLAIKPEVSIYDTETRGYFTNDTDRKSEIYNLALKIEAEKNLYKDAVFLYGNAKLLSSNQSSNIRLASDKNGIRDYDVGLEYRTKDDKIIGVGVGTVSDRYIHEEKNQHKRNYHVDFKFRKKYHSFSEIFSF